MTGLRGSSKAFGKDNTPPVFKATVKEKKSKLHKYNNCYTFSAVHQTSA